MIGEIKVCSKRNLSSELGWVDVYVARPSALGNPFVLKNESDRPVVVAQYRQWLWDKIKAGDKNVVTALNRIAELVRAGKNVRLICWCAPLDCHADVIKRCVEWMLREEKVLVAS